MCHLLAIDFALRIRSRLQGIIVHTVNYFLLKLQTSGVKTSPLGIRVAGDGEEKKRMAFICS